MSEHCKFLTFTGLESQRVARERKQFRIQLEKSVRQSQGRSLVIEVALSVRRIGVAAGLKY